MKFSVLVTARHNACINRQQVRRHPWRKSHFLQVGQALRRARGSHPWLLLIKINSLPKTLGFLPLGSQLQLSLKLEFVLRQSTESSEIH